MRFFRIKRVVRSYGRICNPTALSISIFNALIRIKRSFGRSLFFSRLRREPTVTVREARESKSNKFVQIFQIFFIFFDLFDLANSDYCFFPLGRTDLFDLEWFVRFLPRRGTPFFQSPTARNLSNLFKSFKSFFTEVSHPTKTNTNYPNGPNS